MKGFIEVKKIFADTKKKENVLVNINAIVSVGSYGEFMSIGFQNDVYMFVEDSYLDLKTKIKQATEPRLMIDEKGNLKEMK